MNTGKYWDTAWNPIRLQNGSYYCTKISPGCEHCWAESVNMRFRKGVPFDTPYDDQNPFVINENILNAPFHWKKPRVVAVQWLGDLFHESLSIDLILKVWLKMYLREKHTFLVLTKRVQRMKEFAINFEPDETSNIWYGVTICNQQEGDEKIPLLLQIPGNKWLSIEPMLEPIILESKALKGIGSVVIGCETGPKRRPCKIEWIESIVNQCQEAGIPAWVKAIEINGKVSHDMNEWPESLRVRQTGWK